MPSCPAASRVDLDRRLPRADLSAFVGGDPAIVPAAGRALRQHRLAAGPHRHHRHSAHASWRGSSAPAAMSGAPAAAPSTRASCRAIAPYDQLEFDVPVLEAGDVNARVWVRIREVEQSLRADRADPAAPAGRRDPGRDRFDRLRSGEGLGLAEAFRGDVLVWLRLEGGRVARCHLRDPVLVPMAAAGSRDRGQHRGRLPALQQIVQLLLFGTRPVDA